MTDRHDDTQTLLRAPSLRTRWGMSTSTFRRKRKAGLLPSPIFPFGPDTPYWLLSDVLKHEENAKRAAA
jgi:predicted DNA-binding transcriptional regulator AlpA